MPEFCSCGARLPEDARFCHKCGKPQRDEDVAAEMRRSEAVAPINTAPPPPPLEPPRVSLRDPVSLSTALIATGVTLLLSLVLGPVGVISPIAGGFFAVYLYRKRTGHALTVMNAMRLGWIAGIIVFVLTAVFVGVAAGALSQPELAQQIRDQMTKSTGSSQDVDRILEMLHSASGVALLLVGVFFSSTMMMGLGGAMGALFVGRRGTARM